MSRFKSRPRRQHDLAYLAEIELAANTWLHLTDHKQSSTLSDADEKQLERCRRFLVGVAKDNPNPVPGEDFADVVCNLRKTAILGRIAGRMSGGSDEPEDDVSGAIVAHEKRKIRDGWNDHTKPKRNRTRALPITRK